MRVHKCLLIFFILWLPIQGAVAAILSVCIQEISISHNPNQVSVTIDSPYHHHEGCHKQNDDTTEHLLSSLPCTDHSCDAYSNTPILRDHSIPLITFKRTALTPYNSVFFFYIPEQPQHPPLTILQ